MLRYFSAPLPIRRQKEEEEEEKCLFSKLNLPLLFPNFFPFRGVLNRREGLVSHSGKVVVEVGCCAHGKVSLLFIKKVTRFRLSYLDLKLFLTCGLSWLRDFLSKQRSI